MVRRITLLRSKTSNGYCLREFYEKFTLSDVFLKINKHAPRRMGLVWGHVVSYVYVKNIHKQRKNRIAALCCYIVDYFGIMNLLGF